jgi:hypothetical protein
MHDALRLSDDDIMSAVLHKYQGSYSSQEIYDAVDRWRYEQLAHLIGGDRS